MFLTIRTTKVIIHRRLVRVGCFAANGTTVISLRYSLISLLALLCLTSSPAMASEGLGNAIAVDPGTLVRWSAPATKRCSMDGRSWRALQETCYYPVDLLHKPGLISIKRRGYGHPESARISVQPFPYGAREINLGDIPQANPSLEDLARNKREQRRLLNKIWKRKEGTAQFTLPLGKPISPLPPGKDFGMKQVFNGKPAAQPHTGADYAIPVDTPVLAVADGTVVVAEDLFFPGNAVFIDHGDGLVSMYFHLSQINTKAGQKVDKGDIIGKVGETGRATGPHLFFGIRWHGARIDPRFLIEDPAKIPAVSP
jgi:hypothetical protein